MKVKKIIKRRSFFKKAGLGALGISVLSSIPFASKIFKTKQQKVSVKIHPMAVSRNKQRSINV